MDHALRTISYIADIGNIVVLMARRRMPRAASQDCIETTPGAPEGKKQYKMICHVFESEDVSERRAGPQHCRRLGNMGRWGRLADARGPRGPGATGGPTASCQGRVGGAVIGLLAKELPSPEVLWPRPASRRRCTHPPAPNSTTRRCRTGGRCVWLRPGDALGPRRGLRAGGLLGAAVSSSWEECEGPSCGGEGTPAAVRGQGPDGGPTQVAAR